MEPAEKIYQKVKEILSGPMSLEKAILIAVCSHAGQTDKGGNTYLRHPLRVMEKMDNEDEMTCAVLHDVVEDTDFTLDDLMSFGITQMQAKVIDALTKRQGETYPESISRVIKSQVAKKIKTEDIRDNSQLWRLKNRKLTIKDLERQQNYIDALERMGVLDERP